MPPLLQKTAARCCSSSGHNGHCIIYPISLFFFVAYRPYFRVPDGLLGVPVRALRKIGKIRTKTVVQPRLLQKLWSRHPFRHARRDICSHSLRARAYRHMYHKPVSAHRHNIDIHSAVCTFHIQINIYW